MKEAGKLITETDYSQHFRILESDGSYLFNIQLIDPDLHIRLEPFCLMLAKKRGLAVLPYQAGFVRFSLGGYLDGSPEGYDLFRQEIAKAIQMFLDKWTDFLQDKIPENNIHDIIEDFGSLLDKEKTSLNSLLIRDIKSIYLPAPACSGVNINTISTSKNAVIEFFDNVGSCPNLE